MLPRSFLALALALIGLQLNALAALEIAVFDSDATPVTGNALAYDPMIGPGELSLRCRGVILRGAGEPIVLCAIDWIGVANESHDLFRELLATAAHTTRDRVALHALHQHDAPVADVTSAQVLTRHGIAPGCFDPEIVLPSMERASNAVRIACTRLQPLTHVGWGQAEVHQVASNRRVPGADANVKAVRYTACPDLEVRQAPEGVIDPRTIAIGFWNGDRPVAVLTYYATHPQSYYRTGLANPDFPGIARFLRDQALPGTLHIHFNGAGGNIGAGKYNDGSPTNRSVLAGRLADGMTRAWKSMKRRPVVESDIGWMVDRVHLPVAHHVDASALDAALLRPSPRLYIQAAQLAYHERNRSGRLTDISCLRIGDIRILHMPGELFVEYQLAAQQMRPDLRIAMAAYGDYGPQYIGTEKAYSQGGYETEPSSSGVAPEVQHPLMQSIQRLLDVPIAR